MKEGSTVNLTNNLVFHLNLLPYTFTHAVNMNYLLCSYMKKIWHIYTSAYNILSTLNMDNIKQYSKDPGLGDTPNLIGGIRQKALGKRQHAF